TASAAVGGDSFIDNVFQAPDSDQFALVDQDFFAVPLDTGSARSGHVIFPRGLRVAQVVQVGVSQFQVMVVHPRQGAETGEGTAQAPDAFLADHLLQHGLFASAIATVTYDF